MSNLPIEAVRQRAATLRLPKNVAAFAVVFVLFAAVYSLSLTFVYVEGDDATTIAYHALGRHADLQRPYSAYQSMMDGVLSFLPPNESTLRITAMSITALGPPLVALFIALLSMEWAPGLIRIPLWAAALLVPLLAPELFYLGLVYTPSILALAVALAAHLWLRRRLVGVGTRPFALAGDPQFISSALLFGIGAACRWNILAYGGLVVTDICLGIGLLAKRPRRERFIAAFLWGAFGFASWMICAIVNGYRPAMIWETLRRSGPVEGHIPLPVFIANLQPLATPALMLFLALGCFLLLKRKHPLLLLTVEGVLLTAPFIRFGIPKWIIIAVPALTACALIGFSYLWTSVVWFRQKTAVRAMLTLLILAPWLIGVRALYGDSAYGPGFEVQPFDHPLAAVSRVRLTLGPGVLDPTSEGPRPFGGHVWVLLGGGWRKNVGEGAEQLRDAVQTARERDLPLLLDQQPGFAVSTLAGMGFSTRDSSTRTIGSDFLIERRFVSQDGKSFLRLLELHNKQGLFVPSEEQHLRQLAGTHQVVMYAYTSTLRRCYRLSPRSLEKVGIGTNAAVLDLDRLHARESVAGA